MPRSDSPSSSSPTKPYNRPSSSSTGASSSLTPPSSQDPAATIYSGLNPYLRKLARFAADIGKDVEPIGEPVDTTHILPQATQEALNVEFWLRNVKDDLYGRDQGDKGCVKLRNNWMIFRGLRCKAWRRAYPRMDNGERSKWISVERRLLKREGGYSFWQALYVRYKAIYDRYSATRRPEVQRLKALKKEEAANQAPSTGGIAEQQGRPDEDRIIQAPSTGHIAEQQVLVHMAAQQGQPDDDRVPTEGLDEGVLQSMVDLIILSQNSGNQGTNNLPVDNVLEPLPSVVDPEPPFDFSEYLVDQYA